MQSIFGTCLAGIKAQIIDFKTTVDVGMALEWLVPILPTVTCILINNKTLTSIL